jgi:hypothetical protein
MYGQIVGSAIGATTGAISGAIEAAQRAKEIRQTKRNVRGGIDIGVAESARSVGNIMSTKEYLTAANFIRGFFGIQGDASGDVMNQVQGEFGAPHMGAESSTSKADRGRAMMGATASEQIAANLAANQGAGSQFLSGGGMNSMEQDFVKNLRVSQAARGIEMGAAAGAGEAAGLASFKTQIQMQLVPQLMALAEMPAASRAKYEGSYLNRNVFSSTGGGVAYGQANPDLNFEGSWFTGAAKGFSAGAAQGAAMGSMFDGGGSGINSLFGGGGDAGTAEQIKSIQDQFTKLQRFGVEAR